MFVRQAQRVRARACVCVCVCVLTFARVCEMRNGRCIGRADSLRVCRSSTQYQGLPKGSRDPALRGEAPSAQMQTASGDGKASTIPCVELASKCGFVFTSEAAAAVNQALRGADGAG